MFHDEIVEAIHRIREEYSRSFDHDLKAIFADLQKQQIESGAEVVNLSRKPGLTKRWGGRARDIGKDVNSVQDKRLQKAFRKGFHENYDIRFMKPYEPGYTITKCTATPPILARSQIKLFSRLPHRFVAS
jgi:hypothetical protein